MRWRRRRPSTTAACAAARTCWPWGACSRPRWCGASSRSGPHRRSPQAALRAPGGRPARKQLPATFQRLRGRSKFARPGAATMIESKAFYRKIERAFAGSDNARTRERFAEGFAPRLFEHLGGALGLETVHLYERRGPGLATPRHWGVHRPDIGAELCARGAVNGTLAKAAGDEAIRELPWVGETAAGRTGVFAVGALDGPLIAVFPAPPDGLRTGPTRARSEERRVGKECRCRWRRD